MIERSQDPASYVLLVKMIEALQKACIDSVTDAAGKKGSTKVDQIEVRRHTQEARLSLVVARFDPLKKEGWANETVGANVDKPTDGLMLPPGEVGRGTIERLRGTVTLVADLTGTSEDSLEADRIVQTVLARARKTLNTPVWYGGIGDQYGNSIWQVLVVGDTEYESGADTSNVTRAYIRWVATMNTGGQ